MQSSFVYNGSKEEHFQELLVKIDFIVTVASKNSEASFIVQGYDSKCLIHLNDPDYINVAVSTSLKYNFADNSKNAIEPGKSKQSKRDGEDYLNSKTNNVSTSKDLVLCENDGFFGNKYKLHKNSSENGYTACQDFDTVDQLVEKEPCSSHLKFCKHCSYKNEKDKCITKSGSKSKHNTKLSNSYLEKSQQNQHLSNKSLCDKNTDLNLHSHCETKFNEKYCYDSLNDTKFITSNIQFGSIPKSNYECDFSNGILEYGSSNENPKLYDVVPNTISRSSAKFDSNLIEVVSNKVTLYTCDICSKNFKTVVYLNNHRKTHERCTTCNVCYKSFGSYYKLKQHTKNHTKDKKYMCSTCGKTFKLQNNLRTHMASHSNERPYICSICSKTFKTKSAEIMHRKIHLGLKPFQCETCNKKFTTKSGLRLHLQLHSKLKPFECNVCEKKFFRKDHLKLHTKSHTGQPAPPPAVKIKQYQCETCGKAFTTKRILTVHLRTHTGERPFKCNLCDKKFAQRNALIYHSRMHSGIKPFKCGICAKAFHLKWQLVDHNRVHTGEKPFKCSKCDVSFSVRSNLSRHSKLHK